ncbi:MAG: hypothetical protein AABW72_01475 [archaeon]
MARILGIDFGSSTTDFIVLDNKKIVYENQMVSKPIEYILPELEQKDFKKIDEIHVTGHGAAPFPKYFNGFKVSKIDEIEAIALGTKFFFNKNDFLAASLGSGTCFVSYKKGRIKHVGGTPIGGMTLVGLSKLLFGLDDFKTIEKLATKGNLGSVDLELKDIYPQGLGALKKDATASHFGKIKNPKKEDIALGLFNLVAQGVGINAYFAAKAAKHTEVILSGKLSESAIIKKLIENKICSSVPEIKFNFTRKASFVTACGAAISKD